MNHTNDIQKQPLMVTIRCITYNHEPYIRQCLDGFVMQKTNFRFEAIVHDDASTDGTAAIIREYAEKYPDIIKPIYETENQYSKKDGSLTRIMNEHTHGKYVAICEGDDYWIDTLKLQKQVDYMEAHPTCSMCFHNAFVFTTNKDGGISARLFNDIQEQKDLSAEDVICDWKVPTASILYRKSKYVPPKGLAKIYSGDYSLILCLFINGPVHYLNDSIMSVYRQNFRNGSASSTFKSKFICEQHIILLNSLENVSDSKFEEKRVERIGYLKNEVRFQNNRERFGLPIAAFLMPILSLKKILNRLTSR